MTAEERLEARRIRKREVQRAYYAKHKAKKDAATKAWQARNPDKVAANNKRNREANRERRAEQRRAWLAAHPEKRAEWQARRKARQLATTTEKVSYAAIIARDKSICHICGVKVTSPDMSIDHVIPLSLGGPHTAANLAVAHRSCNFRKSTNGADDQLRLVG